MGQAEKLSVPSRNTVTTNNFLSIITSIIIINSSSKVNPPLLCLFIIIMFLQAFFFVFYAGLYTELKFHSRPSMESGCIRGLIGHRVYQRLDWSPGAGVRSRTSAFGDWSSLWYMNYVTSLLHPVLQA